MHDSWWAAKNLRLENHYSFVFTAHFLLAWKKNYGDNQSTTLFMCDCLPLRFKTRSRISDDQIFWWNRSRLIDIRWGSTSLSIHIDLGDTHTHTYIHATQDKYHGYMPYKQQMKNCTVSNFKFLWICSNKNCILK